MLNKNNWPKTDFFDCPKYLKPPCKFLDWKSIILGSKCVEANGNQTIYHICEIKEVPYDKELRVLEEKDEAKRCSQKPNHGHVTFSKVIFPQKSLNGAKKEFDHGSNQICISYRRL